MHSYLLVNAHSCILRSKCGIIEELQSYVLLAMLQR